MTDCIRKEKSSLIITLKSLEMDLSFIALELNDEYRHLVFDLLEFSDISEEKLRNFTNFGKTTVQNNSFVIVCKTEFAEDFELAQQDVERRDKNAKKRRTMVMWKNALTSVWNTRPMTETQKLIDRMPKIMHAIIEAEGFKTPLILSLYIFA